MYSGTNITTRKGFLKRTGAAIASVFALSSTATAKSQPTNPRAASVATSSALSRVRPAKGAVQYKTTDRA